MTTCTPKNNFVPAVIVLAAVCLSCTFFKDKAASLRGGSATVPSIPPFDPNGPMISPGAYVLRILAEEEPQVAELASQVESAEKRLMKRAIDESIKTAGSNNRNRASSTLPSQGIKRMSSRPHIPNLVGAHFMLQSSELELPTIGDGAFFGGFTGFLKGMLADALSGTSFNKKDTKTEQVEGGTSTMNAEIGLNPDGSSVFEIGIVTETQKNGVKARTELKSRIEGQDCPNAEGQVPITIKLRLAGQSGKARYEQDVTALVRVVVDDNADVSGKTIDVTQATARGRNGNNVFIESGFTFRLDAGQSDFTISNEHVVRKSDNSTRADEHEAAMSGGVVALGAANAAIAAAESAWQGGACIQIVAASPGEVETNSSTSIPVKVVHKKEGTELAAKLESKLEGEASIDPALIQRTPGSLTYVAPAERNKTATIGLTATSRRGRAKLDLTASTARNSYRVNGKSQGASFTGEICSLNKQFYLTVDAITGNWTMDFIPTGDGLSGEMTGTFEANGCTLSGGGPYSVTLNADGSGTITFTYNSTATCPAGTRTTSKTTTLPLTPAPDLSCK